MQVINDPNQIDKKKWSDFVKNHPDGNIFQTPEMFNAYQNTPNYLPIILVCQDCNGSILGVQSAVIQKEYKGIMGFFSARSIIFDGPLVQNGNIGVLNYLLFEYNKIIKRKVIYSQFRNSVDQSIFKETFAKNKFFYEDHLNILLDLRIDEIELFNNFSKSRKKGIRKAQKEEFVFEVIDKIEFIEEFYKLLSNSYNKIKLPFPNKVHFYKVYEYLNSGNVKLFSLSLNGESIVSLFSLIYKGTLYGYYMGTKNDPEVLKKKPIDLFFWHVFKWSMNNNIHFFNWMGAGKPDKSYGVRDFKMQFGGDLVNFGRYEKIHRPLCYLISRIGFNLWKKLKK